MHLTLCTRHFTQKKVYDEIPKQIGALMRKLRDTQVLTTNGTLSKTQLPYML